MRLVHLTDLHLQPERNAPARFRQALDKVRSLQPAPEAMLIGGDVVMNSVGVHLGRVQEQWAVWETERPGIEIPIYSCLGNQDCWGWHEKYSGCDGTEPLFGKAMALLKLDLERPYYGVDLSTWRLLVLDSVQRGGRHGFYSELDEAQTEWFKQELEAAKGRPVLIMSHVPFVAGPADMFSSKLHAPNDQGVWPLPGHHLHRDSYEIVQLLRQYPNVKLCIAGHVHARQRIEYAGTWFIGSPPLCGEWWRGDYLGLPPGFSVLDLFEDGEFRLEFYEF